MSDPLETAFDDFADATQTSLNRMGDELRTFRAEIERLREEQRSVPILTQPEAGAAGKDGVDGKDGRDGKDAVVNFEEIVARVAELTVPRVMALIPTPANGTDGARGERGEDGISSPEEIRSIAREEVMLQQRSFYKGVFAPDTGYRMADAVTWDGSLWFATRDTTTKPGTDDAWRLAVKKGRDAKR